MKSISFPKMFNTNSTRVAIDNDDENNATKQNLKLLLGAEKGELFGDPYFGIRLKKYLFDQNNYVLKDILIDEIYTQIATFIPQVFVKREGIKIYQIKSKAYISIEATSKLTYITNTYNLVLFQEDNNL